MSMYVDADDYIHGLVPMPRTRTRIAPMPEPEVSAATTGMDEFLTFASISHDPTPPIWQNETGVEVTPGITRAEYRELAGIAGAQGGKIKFGITDEIVKALRSGRTQDLDKDILRLLITEASKNNR